MDSIRTNGHINGNELNAFMLDEIFSSNTSAASSNYILIESTRRWLEPHLWTDLANLGVQYQMLLSAKGFYLAVYPYEDLEPIRKKDYVKRVAIYPPSLKIDSCLKLITISEPTATKDILLRFHRDQILSASEIVPKLAHAAGVPSENIDFDEEHANIGQSATIKGMKLSRLDCLAAVDSVEYLQDVGEYVTC